jgi:hypothetical protein
MLAKIQIKKQTSQKQKIVLWVGNSVLVGIDVIVDESQQTPSIEQINTFVKAQKVKA